MKQEEIEVLCSFLEREMSSREEVYTLEEVRLCFGALQTFMDSHPLEKSRVSEYLGRNALRHLLSRIGADVKTHKAVLVAAYPRLQTISGSVPGAHGPGDGPATSGPSSTSGARDHPSKH